MEQQEKLAYYITTADPQRRLARSETVFRPAAGAPKKGTLLIDPRKKHQSILGFGGTFMDSDVCRLMAMDEKNRMSALRALLDPGEGAGWNFMRIAFGSSDWNRDYNYYTYCDVPDLRKFSIRIERERGLLDLLRRSFSIRPDLKLLASVWAIPAWMKDNKLIYHGRFNSAYTKTYVEYLCKAVEAYAKEGIPLHALTFQNESCTSEDRVTPAARVTWFQQRDIAIALKKAFRAKGIRTEIWIFDHNFDFIPYYPLKVLRDRKAHASVDGVALHDYSGSPEEISRLHREFPDMPVYMTEKRASSVPCMGRIVHQLQNFACSYLQWGSISDEYGGPYQWGDGCDYNRHAGPGRGGLSLYNYLDKPNDWRKGRSWYNFSHFTKFIRRGAMRLDSTPGAIDWVRHAAFLNPDGEIVSVAVNETDKKQSFIIRCGKGEAGIALPPVSIMTATWEPGALTNKGYEPVSLSPARKKARVRGPDLVIEDIIFEGGHKAWNKISVSAILRNIGSAPTPANTCHKVFFSLDGDDYILWTSGFKGPLKPGKAVTLKADEGKGGCRWVAEAGWHTFSAHANYRGAIKETDHDNNLFCKDIFIK